MLDPIHPFPARMAPEIAFNFLEALPKASVILDPMCGSGVSLRSAVEKGHRSIGYDADPLAVLMSQVWTESRRFQKLNDFAEHTAERAEHHDDALGPLRGDDETRKFIDYWFAEKQQRDLIRLSRAILRTRHAYPRYITKAMQIALSRLIITKTKGASLAWDVAHSRPHIKKEKNDFNVLDEFVRSCGVLAKKLERNQTDWSCSVRRGDARKMPLAPRSVDAIITSPPYINAIDYMRGHRLSLVWLGYSLKDLRLVRSTSIGSEATAANRVQREGRAKGSADERTQRLIDKYTNDLGRLVREFRRVIKPRGRVCVITANSRISGYEVRTNTLIQAAAAGAGLRLTAETVRKIEKAKRYLPVSKNAALRSRMMEEHIQYFVAT